MTMKNEILPPLSLTKKERNELEASFKHASDRMNKSEGGDEEMTKQKKLDRVTGLPLTSAGNVQPEPCATPDAVSGETPTPRTDVLTIRKGQFVPNHIDSRVPASFARQLERELESANKEIKRLENLRDLGFADIKAMAERSESRFKELTAEKAKSAELAAFNVRQANVIIDKDERNQRLVEALESAARHCQSCNHSGAARVIKEALAEI